MNKTVRCMNRSACEAVSFANMSACDFAGCYWCAYYYANAHSSLNRSNAAA